MPGPCQACLDHMKSGVETCARIKSPVIGRLALRGKRGKLAVTICKICLRGFLFFSKVRILLRFPPQKNKTKHGAYSVLLANWHVGLLHPAQRVVNDKCMSP